jgi:integrase
VPVLGVLRDDLLELRMSGSGNGLVFPGSRKDHFSLSAFHGRALKCWLAARLEPIGLHECRQTCASLMIAAGINAKSLSSYTGHSGIAITYDRYGHLMPNNKRESAPLVDACLDRAGTAARLAARDGCLLQRIPDISENPHG